jgi:putative phage-type endonuclease
MIIRFDSLPFLKDISEELIKNINDQEHIDNQLTIKDIIDIQETIYIWMDIYIKENLIHLRSYKFKKNIKNYIINVLKNSEMLNDIDYDLSDIDIIIDEAIGYYFNIISIPRHYNSYKTPFIDVISIEKRIDILRKKPQPDQRTPEWYLFRGNHITASSAWKSFESEKTKNQLIYSKCAPIDIKKKSGVNINSACHHGHKYEPLSTLIYEKINNTTIEEFGCLEDDDTKYLAASPDGINVNKNSPLYGRLLEIKNPKSREISGIPKNEYWVQMQFQMHVTKLHICDFLETTFTEYENEANFLADGTFGRSKDNKHKGVILCFNDGFGPIYKYSPLDITKDEFDKWYDNELELCSNLSWIKNIWWKTNVYSCVSVLYNKEWFEEAMPYFKNIWNTIVKEREEGYQHRKATKRIPKQIALSQPKPNPNSNQNLTLISNIIIPDSIPNIIRVRTQSFDEIN